MDTEKKVSPLTKVVLRNLHDPIRIRIIVCATLLAAWYFLIHAPLEQDHIARTGDLELQKKRLALAGEIEGLRRRLEPFRGRIPAKADPTEYLQYVLGGIRGFPLKLVNLSPGVPSAHGPLQVVALRIDLEGSYKDVHDFVRWVEDNPRLMRIDSIKIEPRLGQSSSAAGTLAVHLTVVAILG